MLLLCPSDRSDRRGRSSPTGRGDQWHPMDQSHLWAHWDPMVQWLLCHPKDLTDPMDRSRLCPRLGPNRTR